MELEDKGFDDISVGDTASFDRTWTDEDVLTFSALSGDTNPLHIDNAYAERTQFRQRLVHGMLLASLSSRLVGMSLPGKRCLFLSQTIVFKKPVFIGDTVTMSGVVRSKSAATQTLTIGLTMTKDGGVVLEGTMLVQVLPRFL